MKKKFFKVKEIYNGKTVVDVEKDIIKYQVALKALDEFEEYLNLQKEKELLSKFTELLYEFNCLEKESGKGSVIKKFLKYDIKSTINSIYVKI